ncbi:MAG: hypothetical protein ACOVO2_25710, partial [Emticicia sp.]|uniref:hypothetical protein n=1 Tax=Emticicia sp. TaxID=1930953 RepID=UPI003BA62562
LKVQATYADFFTDFDIAPAKTETIIDKGEKGEKGDKSARINAAFPNGQQAKAISINGSVSSTTLAEDLVRLKERGINWNEISDSSDCNCNNTNATIGTINGGGVNLTIRSDHGNVYLRKKK